MSDKPANVFSYHSDGRGHQEREMTKYRPHREFLDESMREVSVVANFSELVALMRSACRGWPANKMPTEDNTKIEPYGRGIDSRTGWNTHIVTVDGAAWGFTDGPLNPTTDADCKPSAPRPE